MSFDATQLADLGTRQVRGLQCPECRRRAFHRPACPRIGFDPVARMVTPPPRIRGESLPDRHARLHREGFGIWCAGCGCAGCAAAAADRAATAKGIL
jgi:ribosomal protein L37AE/L43A